MLKARPKQSADEPRRPARPRRDLQGDLEIFPIIPVLQLLQGAEVSGELSLVGTENSATIYFDAGKLVFASLESRPMRLGDLLVERGVVTSEELEKAIRHACGGRRIGEVLLAAGVIDEASLRDALEEQIKSVVYDVVGWKSGRFFYTDNVAARGESVVLNVPLESLMLEGLRRVDEGS